MHAIRRRHMSRRNTTYGRGRGSLRRRKIPEPNSRLRVEGARRFPDKGAINPLPVGFRHVAGRYGYADKLLPP